MPSKEFEGFLAILRNNPRDIGTGVKALRERTRVVSNMFPPPADVDVVPAMAGTVRAEWISVPENDGDGVLLYFHGGGFFSGSPSTHRDFVSRLCRATGLRGLSIDYRLAPEAPFPAGLHDCVAAYEWLLRQGISPSRIVIAGDSSGGGLALSTLLVLRDGDRPLPAAAVALSPVTDHAQTGHSIETNAASDPIVSHPFLSMCTAHYLGTRSDLRDPLVSPLYGNPRGLPPTLVMAGSTEILLDDSVRWAEKARTAGVHVELAIGEDMVHVWPYFAAMIPEGREGIETIAAFVRRHLT